MEFKTIHNWIFFTDTMISNVDFSLIYLFLVVGLLNIVGSSEYGKF